MVYRTSLHMENVSSEIEGSVWEQNFTIEKRLDSYEIALNVRLEMSGQVQELERMTNMMLPCNLVLRADNQITADAEAELYIGGILSTCMIMEAEG